METLDRAARVFQRHGFGSAPLRVPVRAMSGRGRFLVFAAALALAVRIPLVALEGGLTTPFTNANDVAGYHELARNLAERGAYAYGDHLTAYRPPLYPLFVAAVYRVAGVGAFRAVRLAQTILFLALLPISWGVAHRLGGERAARIACVVTAVYPIFVHYSTEILNESVAIVAVPACLLAFLRAVEAPRAASGALLGAAAAAALMVRPQLLFAVGVMAAVVALAAEGRSKGATAAGAMVVAIALLFSPWVLRNARLFGTFVPFGNYGGFALYEGVTEYRTSDWATHKALLRADLGIHRVDFERSNPIAAPDEIALDQKARALAFAEIRRHPAQFALSTLTHAEVLLIGLHEEDFRLLAHGRIPLTLVAGTLPYWILLGIAAAGLVRQPRDWPAATWILLAPPVVALLATLPFSGAIRYRAPILDLPLIAVASAALARRRVPAITRS